MYSPSGIRTVRFSGDVRKVYEKLIPKSLIVFFSLTLLFFGIDFYGFFQTLPRERRRRARVASAIMCLFYLYTMTTRFAVGMPKYNNAVYLIAYVIKFAIFALICSIDTYSIRKFLIDLLQIEELLLKDINRVAIFGFVFMLTSFICNILSCFAGCFDSPDCAAFVFYLPPFIHCIPIISMDMMTFLQVLVGYSVYSSFKYIKYDLKNGDFNLERVRNRIQITVNCFQKMKPKYGCFVVLTALVECFRLTLFSYGILIRLKSGEINKISLIQSVSFVSVFTSLFLPSAICTLIGLQTDDIKNILHRRLEISRERNRNAAISELLFYMNGRCGTYNVLGTIPVDLKLPISIFSISVTLLIALVQLSHLYDE